MASASGTASGVHALSASGTASGVHAYGNPRAAAAARASDASRSGRGRAAGLEPDPLWYKDAIIYELHVRAFADSNGDGIGDFPGLTGRLDYLQSLGVTAIWLLPFYPSPLRDDGYDVSDYCGVHPAYGTLRDFRRFVREAHRRGLRVVTELVCNHTSDQHPWFQRARRSPPGSVWRDFYVWSDSADRYADARVIFKDFEAANWTWDPVAHAYYWHRFFSHQPDLNFDNPRVRQAMRRVLDFWLESGIDGLRLDAVPYLFEREGTDCENLPETHAFLRELREYVDGRYSGRMLLAEANQWPEQAATYFGAGDECHMAFHFPLMPRLFMALRLEDRFPIADILAQTPPIPDAAQWALFLRNHDELTLEMVTEEERDYLWDVYAGDPQARVNLGIRRRLAPLLGNHRRRIELMNALLFSLPGTPEIYYGDEIGMGDNIYLGDRSAVRTPMQWRADRNAGFSAANRQRLYLPVIVDPEYHYEAVNVEAQEANPHSLLSWMRRIMALRSRYRAFGRGSLVMLHPANRKILAFLRIYGEERILVVANLSRFTQGVDLDLSAHRGRVPVEMFGHGRFPPVGEHPYFITLGPHTFYWFQLEEPPAVPPAAAPPAAEVADPPVLPAQGSWQELLGSKALLRLLPSFLRSRRWFGGKSRRITAASILDAVTLSPVSAFLVLEVAYADGDPEVYALPLAFAMGEQATEVMAAAPASLLARVEPGPSEGGIAGVVYDALADPVEAQRLLAAIAARRKLRGRYGAIVGAPTPLWRRAATEVTALPPGELAGSEQSNTSVRFAEHLLFKVYRRLHEGVQPDLELGRFLTEQAHFTHTPPVLGSLAYLPRGGRPLTLAVLTTFVAGGHDGWTYALNEASAFLRDRDPRVPGSWPDAMRLLGRRTAEMHLALAAARGDPALTPEPFTAHGQRSAHESRRAQLAQTLGMLRGVRAKLTGQEAAAADRLLASEAAIAEGLQATGRSAAAGLRIRCHGDYHLGQVLVTAGDFMIVDFEGEPARSLSDRRRKSSALRDVAGMLRSLHYAAQMALRTAGGGSESEARADLWYRRSAEAFLEGYLGAARDAPFLPADPGERERLLRAYLFEKALYELRYECDHRPELIGVPLRGLAELVGGEH